MKKSRRPKLTRLLALAMVFAMAGTFISSAAIEPEKLIVGKNGWFFYDDEGSLEDFQGTRFFTDSELSAIKNKLLQTEQDLNSQGIQFVVLLTPNKETIYPEYMPDDYGAHPDYTRIDQLYDYLKGDLRVVYPKQELINAKLSYPEYRSYYLTDSHWNDIGAYIAARALMEELGYALPDLGSLSIEPNYFWNGDLIEDMDLEINDDDYSYVLRGYGPYTSVIMDQDEWGNYFWEYTEGAPAQNLTIYGDSFSMAMITYLGQFFENVYLHRFNWDSSLVEQESPSVVVYQVLERYLDQMK